MPAPSQGHADGSHSWHATAAMTRALLGGLVVAATALLAARPDVLVIGTPLLVAGLWQLFLRPPSTPTFTAALAPPVVREGQATTWRVRVRGIPSASVVWVAADAAEWVTFDPAWGAVAARAPAAARPAAVDLRLGVVPLRWGRRTLSGVQLGVTASWGYYRWNQAAPGPAVMTVVPVALPVQTGAPAPHPVGLVGQNRSRSLGDGAEFAGMRPFLPGDRLRRINWRASVRPGPLQRAELVVTTMHADQDAGVVVLLDASVDIGVSEGLAGRASSLDVSVRVAAGMLEHFLASGDRVGLQVLDPERRRELPVHSGDRHRRRALHMLASVRQEAQVVRSGRGRGIGPHAVPVTPGSTSFSVLLLLSPLLSRNLLGHAVSSARRGTTTIVVDTLPSEVLLPEVGQAWSRDLAWRLRLLEHDHASRALRAAGLPVVRWTGPASLDPVLRLANRRPGTRHGGADRVRGAP